MICFQNLTRYARRVARMTWLLTTRTVSWSSFAQSLRPEQVSVQTRGRGMVFCDRDTERIAFGEPW